MDSGRALVAEAAVGSCPDDATGEAICAVVALERSLAKGEAITQDTSTLDKPAILEQFSHSN